MADDNIAPGFAKKLFCRTNDVASKFAKSLFTRADDVASGIWHPGDFVSRVDVLSSFTEN